MEINSISQLYALFKESRGISIDTRQLQAGQMYWALRGNRFNGNDFAKEALEKGAFYAVIDDEKVYEKNKGVDSLVKVENTLVALQCLARYHREQCKDLKVVGITGSNGKTTTKNLIAAVLAKKYSVFATPGNKNNHIGLPLSVLSLSSFHQVAVLELGDNHPGEIEFLCSIAQPNWGLITNIGYDHMEFYEDLSENANTKLALFEYVYQREGKIFVNYQDYFLRNWALGKKNDKVLILYNSEDSLRYEVRELRIDGLRLEIFQKQEPVLSIRSRLVGKYNAENILAAVVVGKALGVELEMIQEAIEAYVSKDNRSEYLEKGKWKVLLDAYNANPSSMRAALQSLLPKPNSQVVVILGDMNELGNFSAKAHQEIAQLIIQLQPGCFIGIGEWMCQAAKWVNKQNSKTHAYGFNTLGDFLLNGIAYLVPYEVIFIKGSRSLALEKIVDYLDGYTAFSRVN
ncbi:MAG: UDP-N-acetylmuramoyl-tripeptide--D-alanyl-D-alanine ligase [Bacteroidia bacterium]|nr:UDP-N-acetylmuramoyl-tripeptide--D-alanyl-D-alanine ligase [Bacteroidia bacterium]MDW8158581.1 UDP-N-acetylmuramoyl-tripeptide--D-alanyl-D-alanine ligase [Bacteroidia bacterium]